MRFFFICCVLFPFFFSLSQAQSENEIEILNELMQQEKQIFDPEKTSESREEHLKNYLFWMEHYFKVFPSGSYAKPLKEIYDVWQQWRTSCKVTLKGYEIEIPKKTKGLPKPDLFLKCFVEKKLVFQTKPTKNKYHAKVEGEITFPFKVGDHIRFEVWDKDLFKDDLLDSIAFKSLCLQELTQPMTTQYKGFSLRFKYEIPIPKVKQIPQDPLQTKYLEALALYQDGDFDQAFKRFTTLAQQSYPPAQAKLGECYYRGQGTTAQPIVALVWFQKAAEKGQSDGQYYLGEVYLAGKGAEKNEKQAFKWFEAAAKQGHSEAQFELGCYYLEGIGGIIKDKAKGLQLLEQAKAGNSPSATLMLQKLNSTAAKKEK